MRAAIEPFDTPGAERFLVQVIEIDVGPAAVLSLAMALNELCTNAVKYGALSNTEGPVEITSAFDEDAQRFRLFDRARCAERRAKPEAVVDEQVRSAAIAQLRRLGRSTGYFRGAPA